jgi:predicted 3-demethylubiquinone-9 3-methyltransferase (glyoxalase superfamily)
MIMATMQKITPTFWFNGNAVEAVKFYTSVFKNSKMGRMTRYGKAGFEFHHQPEGSPMTVEFELEGQKFLALNAGPDAKFNKAVSFIIHCDSQEEIDYYWGKLSENGDPAAQDCGWLQDQFGMTWQVMPANLPDLIADPEKAELVLSALTTMKKPDIDALHRAYKGKVTTLI